jgi:hypothetical protein
MGEVAEWSGTLASNHPHLSWSMIHLVQSRKKINMSRKKDDEGGIRTHALSDQILSLAP